MLNTKGAAALLSVTENWIHKLVYSGRIKAYVYDEHGTLIEHQPHTPRQGQGLYFHEKDVTAYKNKRRRVGRPRQSKRKTRQQDESLPSSDTPLSP